MAIFKSFSGIITAIEVFETGEAGHEGCYKMMSVQNKDGGIVNFIVTPLTYFVDHVMMRVGDMATGFYDASAPALMIFPPQFETIVMTQVLPGRNVKVDYFDKELISSDGMLRLNISPQTQIMLENDQQFTGSPANRHLIVIYGATTRSIPAQTRPEQIVVMC
jgi:hypothetical protein